jgi:transporter family protein
MWFVYALGSAVFAALTSILAKIGIEGVNSTLATAIRTAVVLLMSWGMVFLTGTQAGIAEISRRSWLFLVLSGLATGASWLCYYHALQVGAASKVVLIDKLSVVITLALAFVVLHEPFTAKSLIGCALITAVRDALRAFSWGRTHYKNRSSWMRLSSSKSCNRWARRFAPGAALG